MLERQIEQKLVREVKKQGGLAIKLVPTSFVGVPDRLILMAKGRLAFVEVKRRGEKPRNIQKKRHEQIRRLGFKVFVLDNESQIGGLIDEIFTT